MKTRISFVILFTLMAGLCFGQKYITKTAYVYFFSTTPAEDIVAKNRQVNVAFDRSNGKIIFKVLMKSFAFDKALMQEHFNKNYVESDKYPEASFKGKIINLKDINFKKGGVYKVTVEGNLNIHGVTKKIREEGTIQIKGEKIVLKAKFLVKTADYEIKIPKASINNIAETIEINVEANLDKQK